MANCVAENIELHLSINPFSEVKDSPSGMHYYYITCAHCHAPTGAGIAEGDENCKKFMDRTLPDSFFKV